jgi:hypothetical protein
MAHPSLLFWFLASLLSLSVPPLLSRMGFGNKLHWSIYAMWFPGALMIAAVSSGVLKFVLEMLGSTETDQQALRYFGQISVAVAICSFFGGSFASSIAERRRH